MMNIAVYSKAIVGAAVAGLSWLALKYGIEWSPEIEAAVTTIITGVFVWLVPNSSQSTS